MSLINKKLQICIIHSKLFKTGITTSSLPHHEECSNKLLLLNDCQLANHIAWIIVNEDSKGQCNAKTLVTQDTRMVKQHFPNQFRP